MRAETIVITGARIHTMDPAGPIESGTVVITDDLIAAVGASGDVDLPAGARIIDAAGKIMTPGLFDAYSQIGVAEISLIEETVDSVQSDSRYTASFEVADAINPRSVLIPFNRVEGVTRAMVAPSGELEALSSPVVGLGSVISLGDVDQFISRRNAALFVILGEDGAALSGGARGNTLLRLREALDDARDFAANRASYDAGARREYSLSRRDLEALQPVLSSAIPLVAEVYRASDIRAALRVAQDFDLRLVINGGAEAWLVAAELAAANVPVILDPIDNLPGSFEALAATTENAARLHAAGVVVAFSTEESHNASNMKQLAGNAVAHGLPYDTALQAITLNPARIYGLGERLGSISVGKAADLVIWDGDPLELTTFAEQVFIGGREIPMVNRSTLLRDRYLELDEDLPPAFRN